MRQRRGERPASIDRLDGVLTSVTDVGLGNYAFTLADGSRWVTQESDLMGPPTIRQNAAIRRGAMGSYRVTFAGMARSVQVRRVR